jgi:hypothetical protein
MLESASSLLPPRAPKSAYDCLRYIVTTYVKRPQVFSCVGRFFDMICNAALGDERLIYRSGLPYAVRQRCQAHECGVVVQILCSCNHQCAGMCILSPECIFFVCATKTGLITARPRRQRSEHLLRGAAAEAATISKRTVSRTCSGVGRRTQQKWRSGGCSGRWKFVAPSHTSARSSRSSSSNGIFKN